ncbi:ABC-ATPase domain-containing protein [Anaerolentibacter hominis]|uniref:ABC-ATPase domain-containing protein n=1 Tax=Anaerolentibacter hominis TaxID=3079009 RepID=UPI0031B7F710
MNTEHQLRQTLAGIDRKSYGYYKSLAGSYTFKDYTLHIDHVQGDPFASPSRVRITVPAQIHGFSSTLYDRKCKKLALEDYILRQIHRFLSRSGKSASGSGKSGLIFTCPAGQKVLERAAVVFGKSGLEVRLEIGFPARGRSILASEMETILFRALPALVSSSLIYKNLNQREINRAVSLSVNQTYLREQLKTHNLAAFVADGSVLPRESGISDRPMRDAIPFTSPEHMRIQFTLPDGTTLSGMALPRGITVITGGGYHGKSTLLRALEAGVYNHIPGDGREYVVTDETAVKLRAEDGRRISHCDISAFINHLPGGQNTSDFVTENASGSTSQAANTVEAIEAGAGVFLIDEDTSATNFMIRDSIIAKLVSDEEEPITPFIRRIRGIYENLGISTVVVVGSSGDYLAAADTVLQLDRYLVKDVTAQAKQICADCGLIAPSVPQPHKSINIDREIAGLRSKSGREGFKIKAQGRDSLVIDRETIDLRYLEQLIDPAQIAALGYMTAWLLKNTGSAERLSTQIDRLYQKLEREGLTAVMPSGYPAGQPVMVRKQELFACLNRYRSLLIEHIR